MLSSFHLRCSLLAFIIYGLVFQVHELQSGRESPWFLLIPVALLPAWVSSRLPVQQLPVKGRAQSRVRPFAINLVHFWERQHPSGSWFIPPAMSRQAFTQPRWTQMEIRWCWWVDYGLLLFPSLLSLFAACSQHVISLLGCVQGALDPLQNQFKKGEKYLKKYSALFFC